MWNILKSIFRYSFKHKVSLITLTFLTFLSTGIFGSLLTLSSNLSNAYEKLVTDGNINNLTIHELYSTSVDEQPDLHGDVAKAENKRLFLAELDKLIGSQNYRRFNSIDYNTTNSGFAYKIIQNDPNYAIDKLVIYEGSDTLDVTYDFNTIINDALWSDDSPKAARARWMLIFFASRATWTNNQVAKNMITAFNVIKDTPDADPKKNTVPIPQSARDLLQQWTEPTNSKYTPIVNKQYRLAFNVMSGLIPVVGVFDNFTTYSSVVPLYILEQHNLSILPEKYMLEYKQMSSPDSLTTNHEFDTWIRSVPSNYKIKIDNLEYLIIGNGLAPSFMYPVYSFDKAIPNSFTEIFLFSNYAGYQLAYDSNRSSPVDDYLIAKVNNLSSTLLNEINALAKKYMSWPSNIHAAYAYNDTSNLLSPAPIRVSFLPSLVTMQVGLSNSLSIFIALLNGIIFVFSIRKFIEDNQDSLAILRANGVKKRTIVISTSLFGLIPGTVGGIFGYLFTQFTQIPFISLYSQYWMVPTAIAGFNPLLFFGLAWVPFVVMAIISMLFSYLILRRNASSLMNDNGKFKITPTGKFMGLLFAKTDILTRFRSSIAFSSLPKLCAITILFTLVATSITFATSITDKFDEAKKDTFASKNYNFSLDLNTPTVQGGQYFPIVYDNLGKTIVNDKNEMINYNVGVIDNGRFGFNTDYIKLKKYIYQNNELAYYNPDLTINPNFTPSMTPFDTASPINELGTLPTIHFPTYNDSSFQKFDALYLKNRAQSPFTVDLNVGLGAFGTNPWDVARSLAPSNVTLNADKLTHQLWEQILNDENVYYTNEYISTFVNPSMDKPINPLNYVGKKFNEIFINFNFLKYVNPQPSTVDPANYDFVYKKNDDPTYKSGWYQIIKSNLATTSLNNNFLVLAAHIYNSPIYADNIFYNTYNSIAVENTDETFTRINADLISADNWDDQISIKGIKPDTKFVNLINQNNEHINHKLKLLDDIEMKYAGHIHDIYNDPTVLNNPNNYKVVINESAAYQYNLQIGSKIVVNPVDEATRFNPKLVNNPNTQDFDKYNNRVFELEVIDIIQTYQYPEFYINQRIANHMNAMDYKTILDTSYQNEYIYDSLLYHDVGIIAHQIDPFNGIFSDSINPKSISNSSPLYSESGLYPATDKFSESSQIFTILESALRSTVDFLSPEKYMDQYKYMSKIQIARMMGFADENGVVNMPAFEAVYCPNGSFKVQKLYNDLVSIYGINPLLSIIYNVEYVNMYVQLFDNLSIFVNNIVILILVILLTISILSVMFLSVEFISSAISVIAILKVLGFYDNANAFAFLSMFFPAAIIATGLSVPISISLISLMKSFIYGFGSILLPLAYQWWYFLVPLILFFIILGITVGVTILMLKRQDITKAITR